MIVSSDETVSPRAKTIKRADGTLSSMELEHMWPAVEGEGVD